eukprot:CAMPEP_0118947126 /NCGR_PEP_ID=MMETSP1169-20130426/45421_1 /TAXON_ID=36882 /ORGANISM="Pyramimonas obovata, Strain CCMP722" /LENGTH=79 /DNA_ID=CAMNT_0006893277 /DNA_START=118 /DNA_END=358 /DNA_ORIENTATION=-
MAARHPTPRALGFLAAGASRSAAEVFKNPLTKGLPAPASRVVPSMLNISTPCAPQIITELASWVHQGPPQAVQIGPDLD